MPPCAHAAHLQSEPIPEFVFARAQDPAAKSEQANRCLTYAAAALYYLQGQSCGIIGQFVSAFFLPLLSSNCLPSADAYMKVQLTQRMLTGITRVSPPYLCTHCVQTCAYYFFLVKLNPRIAYVRRWHHGYVPCWLRLMARNCLLWWTRAWLHSATTRLASITLEAALLLLAR